MLFLVLAEGQYIDPLTAPPERVEMLRKMVIPGLEKLASIEGCEVLAGGLIAGTPDGVAIINSPSATELNNLLMRLPLWPTMKWKTHPLVTFSERANFFKDLIGETASSSQ